MDLTSVAKKTESTNAYAPGLSERDLSLYVQDKKIINLASNESPHHINKSVLEQLQKNIKDINRYPDNDCINIKKALSEYMGVKPDLIFLGNGSSEVLSSIGKCFVDSKSEIIYSQYSFVVYKMIAEAIGCKSIVTPAKNWGHDLDIMRRSITPSTKMIFIANPNNPTGTWLEKNDLAEFIKNIPSNIIVVIDEAYFEFAANLDILDATKLVENHKNLIVTRTFSKAYGLAGIRLGYAVAHPAIIEELNKAKLPYSINSLALAAGEAAIKDVKYLANNIDFNNKEKNRIYQEFDKLGIEYIVSAANFVAFNAGPQFNVVYDAFIKNGILLRPLSNYDMNNYLRVTIGTKPETDEFIKALKSSWLSGAEKTN